MFRFFLGSSDYPYLAYKTYFDGENYKTKAGQMKFWNNTDNPDDPENGMIMIKYPLWFYLEIIEVDSVLEFDTNSHALLYDCNVFLGLVMERAWIISRTRSLPDVEIGRMRRKLKHAKIDVSDLNFVDQDDCR